MSDWMKVIAILRELSRCSSERFDLIVPFLCFRLENSCSQRHVLPKKNCWQKWGLTVKWGIFSSAKLDLVKSGEETGWIFWVEYLIPSLYIPFEKLQVMHVCWLKEESQRYQNFDDFLCNFGSYFQVSLTKRKAWLLIFHCSRGRI